jgi:hypothetical protein
MQMVLDLKFSRMQSSKVRIHISYFVNLYKVAGCYFPHFGVMCCLRLHNDRLNSGTKQKTKLFSQFFVNKISSFCLPHIFNFYVVLM